MIYLLGSSKGGVGKSTFAVNLAAWLAAHGRDVLLVDTDVQRHASAWIHERGRQQPMLPAVHLGHAFGRDVPRILRQHAQRYQDLVVDAGGRDSRELRGALQVAHVLLVPVVPSQFDLYALNDVAALVDEARLYRDQLDAAVFLNKLSTNWVLSGDEARAREALASLPQLRTLDAAAHLRRPFATSVEDGRAVFEMGTRGDAAAEEFAAIAESVVGATHA